MLKISISIILLTKEKNPGGPIKSRYENRGRILWEILNLDCGLFASALFDEVAKPGKVNDLEIVVIETLPKIG